MRQSVSLASGAWACQTRIAGGARRRHACALVRLSWIAVFAGAGLMGCREEKPDRFYAVNPSFVEWYSLRESPDEAHETAVTDVTTGRTWYRSKTPGLDLRHFRCADAHAGEGMYGKYAVYLPVTKESRTLLASWFEKQVGSYVGAVWDGQLLFVTLVESPIRDGVCIPAFGSWDEAGKAVAEVRSGGIPLETASGPSSRPAP